MRLSTKLAYALIAVTCLFLAAITPSSADTHVASDVASFDGGSGMSDRMVTDAPDAIDVVTATPDPARNWAPWCDNIALGGRWLREECVVELVDEQVDQVYLCRGSEIAPLRFWPTDMPSPYIPICASSGGYVAWAKPWGQKPTATPIINPSGGTPTATPRGPLQLLVSYIVCNGQNVEIGFVVNNLPTNVANYGTVRYTVNGQTRQATFVSRTGDTALYRDLLPPGNGAYTVTNANVTIDGATVQLLESRSVNITNCSRTITPTPAGAASVTPTPRVSNTQLVLSYVVCMGPNIEVGFAVVSPPEGGNDWGVVDYVINGQTRQATFAGRSGNLALYRDSLPPQNGPYNVTSATVTINGLTLSLLNPQTMIVTNCQLPTPTPVPTGVLSTMQFLLDHIICTGQNIEIGFVVNGVPDDVVNFGTVQYVINGQNRQATFVSRVGDVAFTATISPPRMGTITSQQPSSPSMVKR